MSDDWRLVDGWQYCVSQLGHIKRKRGRRRVRHELTPAGFTRVWLERGKRSRSYWLDSLILAVFRGAVYNDVRPVHLDGRAWNNWLNNLDGGVNGMQISRDDERLVAQWSVWHDGHFQHGPFGADYQAAVACAQWKGDCLIGRNGRGVIIAFQVNFCRDRGMSPVNPYDKAREYRAAAQNHPNQMWSIMLSEAAELIEALADSRVSTASGKQLQQVEEQRSEEPTAAPPRRRRVVLEAPIEVQQRLRRRKVA